MIWELVAIWAICAASVAGFVITERRSGRSGSVDIFVLPEPELVPIETSAPHRDREEARRRRLRSIGF
jgi:hypothetical protein